MLPALPTVLVNPLDLVLARFEQISGVPRGTRHEARIRQWLVDWAASRGLASRTDAVGNLAVYVPASAGHERAPTVVLQGHLDMVWQKTPACDHDFTRDPIRPLRDGDWLRADGTTLGADNGIAIALMMALVEDEFVVHPALELLLTVEEEQGVAGADRLDPDLLSGKLLVNLDSEEEGKFTIGCAGGTSTYITLPVSWGIPAGEAVALEIAVDGLRGGHSGEDIHKHRGNAIKLIARVLDAVQRRAPVRLAAFQGGTARNAIPREARAVAVVPEAAVSECREAFAAMARALTSEAARTEPGLTISLEEHPGNGPRAIGRGETETAIRLLMALPNGVARMSAAAEGCVETSNNIGVVALNEDGLRVVSSQRSSVLSRLEEMARRVEALARLAGAAVEQTKVFPPWRPDPDSPLLEKCLRVYEATFGVRPAVEVAHGGLECGIIGDRCGGLDAISLGPTIENPHSPSERLHVPSVARVWDFLVALLRSC